HMKGVVMRKTIHALAVTACLFLLAILAAVFSVGVDQRVAVAQQRQLMPLLNEAFTGETLPSGTHYMVRIQSQGGNVDIPVSRWVPYGDGVLFQHRGFNWEYVRPPQDTGLSVFIATKNPADEMDKEQVRAELKDIQQKLEEINNRKK